MGTTPMLHNCLGEGTHTLTRGDDKEPGSKAASPGHILSQASPLGSKAHCAPCRPCFEMEGYMERDGALGKIKSPNTLSMFSWGIAFS